MPLAITRRPKKNCDRPETGGHSFTVDGPATITVYEIINENKVRVSIDAAQDVHIVRDDANSTADRHSKHGGRGR